MTLNISTNWLRGEFGLVSVAALLGLLVATLPLEITGLLTIVIAFAVCICVSPTAALIGLLVLAPLRTLIFTEAPGLLPVDIGQLLVVVFIGVWVLRRIADGKRLLYFTWSDVFIPLLFFISGTAITAFGAVSLGAWFNEWLKWVLMAAFVLVVLNMAHQWEWLVFGLILAGTANAVIGLYIFFGGSGADHLIINNRFFRAFGTFGQPNPFGGFMGLLAPVALMLTYGYMMYLWERLRQSRSFDLQSLFILLFYASCALLLVIGVFISWSRGAWLGFGVALVAMAFALPHKLWQSILLVVVIAGLVGLIWSSGRIPETITQRVTSATQEIFILNDVRAVDITGENYAIVERLAHWQAALNMAESNFWFGVGFDNYETTYAEYRLINWDEALGHAHNYYLNVLGETGIIGLLTYMVALFGVLMLIWRARRHPDHIARGTVIGILGTWVYLMTHSLTDNLYVNNIFLHFGVMLGVLAVIYNQTYQRFYVGKDQREWLE
jgi:putative inorganic carbon (hco3(-)) transporter